LTDHRRFDDRQSLECARHELQKNSAETADMSKTMLLMQISSLHFETFYGLKIMVESSKNQCEPFRAGFLLLRFDFFFDCVSVRILQTFVVRLQLDEFINCQTNPCSNRD